MLFNKSLSRKSGQKVSDINIDPQKESYKIYIRKDGIKQKFISMSKESGIQFLACLKDMANFTFDELNK